MTQADYETDTRAAKEIEALVAINQQQLELIKELRAKLNKKNRPGNEAILVASEPATRQQSATSAAA